MRPPEPGEWDTKSRKAPRSGWARVCCWPAVRPPSGRARQRIHHSARTSYDFHVDDPLRYQRQVWATRQSSTACHSRGGDKSLGGRASGPRVDRRQRRPGSASSVHLPEAAHKRGGPVLAGEARRLFEALDQAFGAVGGVLNKGSADRPRAPVAQRGWRASGRHAVVLGARRNRSRVHRRGLRAVADRPAASLRPEDLADRRDRGVGPLRRRVRCHPAVRRAGGAIDGGPGRPHPAR